MSCNDKTLFREVDELLDGEWKQRIRVRKVRRQRRSREGGKEGGKKKRRKGGKEGRKEEEEKEGWKQEGNM